MKLGIIAVGACLAGAVALSAAAPQESKTSKQSGATDAKAVQIARGKYLVDRAGKCGDCHTPMDKKGQPVKGQELQGAPLPFKPAAPIPGWADTSMPIAGLPTMASDADAISFFTTGKHLDGKVASPPMPQYRFNKKDAEAIVAYLKSLGS